MKSLEKKKKKDCWENFRLPITMLIFRLGKLMVDSRLLSQQSLQQ